MSTPRIAALCLAARRYGRPLLHAGGAAMAASEGRPPAGNAGMLQGRFRGLRPRGDGAKLAFVLPIRVALATSMPMATGVGDMRGSSQMAQP